MTLTTKILLICMAIVVACSVGFVVYKEHQLSQQQADITASMVAFKQMQDGFARSQASFATKSDLDTFAAQNNVNLNQIRSDLNTLGATITGLNQITVVSGGGPISTNIPSTSTTPNPVSQPPTTVSCNGATLTCPNDDPYGYRTNIQHLDVSEPFSSSVNVPEAQVSFDASSQKPWSVSNYKRTYNIVNVVGTDKNGREYVYNKFTINSNGKNYSVPITNASFEQEYPSPSLSWNFRPFLGVDGAWNATNGNATVVPNLSMSIASYGATTITPDLTFANVGVGVDAINKNVQLQLSPVQYNLGQHITFMHNTYIGPSVGVGTDKSFTAGIGIKVGL